MNNTTVFRLIDDITTLEEVENKILTLQYKEEIKHVPQEIIEMLPDEEEKFFYSKWHNYEQYTSIDKITLPNDKFVRFLIKETYIETSKQKRNMFEFEKLLPKSERIVTDIIKTIFYEINNKVYVILFTTYSTSINKIKQKLFDEGTYLESAEDEYRFNSDLFYWLFYKYKEKNRLITDRFEVEAISGFLGNISDEHHKVTSESELTPNLLVTKAFVSKFHPIKSLDIILKIEDFRLCFIVNDNSQCSIGTNSIIPNWKYEVDIATSIIVYAYVLPRIFDLFEKDKEWTSITKKEFTKKIGEEVIIDIATFHGINLETLAKNI